MLTPYSWTRRSWITLPLSRISDLSIASISGATSSTTRRGRWPAASLFGGATDAGSFRYLLTVRRFSPVSFAISRRLIAPDSYSGRNRLNFSQRCGSKTTVSRLPATPNRQQQTHGRHPVTASRMVHFHPYEVVHVR